MKFKMIVISLSLVSITLSAQHVRFLTEGVIEFERSTNAHALINKRMKRGDNNFMGQVYEQYKKSTPQFIRSKSTLYFSKDKTLFQPIEDESVPNRFFAEDPAINQINHIYADLAEQKQITQKKVYEETFLVSDSTRKINWKITEERREIAGYSCRRANAVIMDSIYVVAFYCDQIPVSGGPETFTGLPGMILGVALPYEHVTWFATKITEATVSEDKLKAPVKGKPVNNKALFGILNSAMKEHGSNGQEMLKALML